eukprot:6133235-Prymnesium_polylepis.1
MSPPHARRRPRCGDLAPRSRASPSARSSTSRTILNVRTQRLVDDLDGLPVRSRTLGHYAATTCHAH